MAMADMSNGAGHCKNRSKKSTDQFMLCFDTLSEILMAQAGLMRNFVVLHPHPPDDFDARAREATAIFSDSVKQLRTNLMSAAGGGAILGETSSRAPCPSDEVLSWNSFGVTSKSQPVPAAELPCLLDDLPLPASQLGGVFEDGSQQPKTQVEQHAYPTQVSLLDATPRPMVQSESSPQQSLYNTLDSAAQLAPPSRSKESSKDRSSACDTGRGSDREIHRSANGSSTVRSDRDRPFDKEKSLVRQLSRDSFNKEPLKGGITFDSMTDGITENQWESRALRFQQDFDLEWDEDCAQDDAQLRKRCPAGTLNPRWIGRKGWDVVMMALVLIDSLFLPFQLAFKSKSELDAFELFWMWLLTGFFLADIILNFFTAYEATQQDIGFKTGALVTSHLRIASRYVRTWFLLDVLVTIPWWYVSQLLQSHNNLSSFAHSIKVIRLLRALRVVRVLRLAKMASIWQQIDHNIGSSLLLQFSALFRVLFVIFVICHWNACMWWMVGQDESLFTETFLPAPYRESFKAQSHWTSLVRTNAAGFGHWRWVDQLPADQYTFCFYWTLGVMRTMPSEVMPVNRAERIYAMVFMFFAFSAFAIGVATITQAFFKFFERNRSFDEDMAAVRTYLQNIGAAEPLQESVTSFLQLLFDRRRLQAKETMLFQHLPPRLVHRLKCAKLSLHLRKVPVLKDVSESALAAISLIAEVRDLVPGDVVCRRGYPAEAVWILMSGGLQVFQHAHSGKPETPEVVDEDCLDREEVVESQRTVFVASCSEVLKVSKKDFFQLSRKSPVLGQHLLRRFEARAWEREWEEHIAVEADTPLLA